MTSSANADGACEVLLRGHVTAVLPRHTVRFHGTQTRARCGALLLHVGIRRGNLLRCSVLAGRSAIALSRGSSGCQFLGRPFLERTLVIRRRDLMRIAHPLRQVIVLPRVFQNRFQALAGLQFLFLFVRLPRFPCDLLHSDIDFRIKKK